ncbi:MAG: TolC family protein [Burkholderiaceae bacterium]|nr:TolC family protein [Burkholderiaceae bacterium]
MSIRQLILFSGAALVLSAGAQPSGSVQTTPVTLTQALQAARNHPDIGLARQAMAAARADIASADHAPLPVFSAKTASIDLQNGVGAGSLGQKRIDKALGIDWTWERGNKRALRTETAQRAADAASFDVDDVQVQVLQATLAAFYDLMAADQRLREMRGIEHSAAELARLANRRVQAGDLSAQDAARTEIEAQRARADLQMAVRDQQRALALLTQLAGAGLAGTLQADGAWPLPGDSALPGAELAAWVEGRPEVRAALARVQAAQGALDNALALRKSDWTVGASLNHYPGISNRMVELRVQVPLQVGYAYEGEIGRAQAQQAQAQQALDKVRRLAELDLRRLQQELASATQRLASLDAGILPRARQVAENAELAYAKGALSLTDLLDARRTLRATVLDALSARADHAKALGAWWLRTQPDTLLPAS